MCAQPRIALAHHTYYKRERTSQDKEMPPKKAAKKAATKTAHRHPSHDLRRAYEYLGRVDILEGALAGVHFRHVSALAKLAEKQVSAGQKRDAADLLRAAEHICFAALAPEERSGTVPLVSTELKAAIATELIDLTRRAEDHWSSAEEGEPHETLAAIYVAALDQSLLNFNSGAYRAALELARAAEALAHVARRPQWRISEDKPAHRLAS